MPNSNDGAIDRCVVALDDGGVVGIPTDTVYGVAARFEDPGACDALFALKGRELDKPVAVLVSSLDQARHLGGFGREAEALAEAFWPGPLTLVVSAAPEVASRVHSKTATIGLRWAASALIDTLIDRCGPLLATSANPAGRQPATSLSGLIGYFGGELAATIDGGPAGTTASTVLAADAAGVRILREGAVGAPEIDAVLAALP